MAKPIPHQILSAKVPICPNSGKHQLLKQMIADFREVEQRSIDLLWSGAVPGFNPAKQRWDLPKYFPDGIESSIGGRPTRCATSSALASVRSVTVDLRSLQYAIKKQRQAKVLNKELIAKLQSRYDKKLAQLTKPNASNSYPELNVNACITQIGRGSFEWVFDFVTWNKRGTDRYPAHLPIPGIHTKHHQQLVEQGGRRMNSIELQEDYVVIRYEFTQQLKEEGSTEGADPGVTHVLTLSDRQVTPPCIHGHTLSSINKKFIRKKNGSKAATRAKAHQKNYINWSIKQLDFSKIKQLNVEQLFDMRRGQRTSVFLQKFDYRSIETAIRKKAFGDGVHIQMQSSSYRSQRCSDCGFVHRLNRSGSSFVCRACGFVCDADLNAAINHRDPLPVISRAEVQDLNRTTGFYWLPSGMRRVDLGEAPIVPLDTEMSHLYKNIDDL